MSDFVRIPLTKGREAIIDAEDYAIVIGAARSWHACPQGKSHYAQARALVTKQVLMMHRVIMHAPKGLLVDHKNHDTLDNRKSNLRIVTRQQNQCNVLPRQGNHSRFKGVCLNKRVNQWVGWRTSTPTAREHISGISIARRMPRTHTIRPLCRFMANMAIGISRDG